jgi:epoxyqueuosine reductase
VRLTSGETPAGTPSLKRELTQAIKSEAQRLGFELVGVTTPDPPPHFDVFERWLDAGRHGKMAYLVAERSRQRRGDPKEILPECRSILVLGIRYGEPGEGNRGEGEKGIFGQVAAYAWGADYHEVIPEHLKRLVAFIEAQVGQAIPNRIYTDTGPVLERELAQRAGLGWIGKNTCLISPQHGSYFLLAEVLLGIELETDPPLRADHCGTCTRCIEACPTGCILPDRTLDATRCISYLTIELKGAIPQDLRPQTGKWVFGCDLCQAICPWNLRFAASEGDPALAPRPQASHPDLSEELKLDAQGFNRKFKGSPVRRAKRRGYLRNVAVALGNSLKPEALPWLAAALQDDPEPLVRSHCAWAMGRIGTAAAHQALTAALESEPEPVVQEEIRQALQTVEKALGDHYPHSS